MVYLVYYIGIRNNTMYIVHIYCAFHLIFHFIYTQGPVVYRGVIIKLKMILERGLPCWSPCIILMLGNLRLFMLMARRRLFCRQVIRFMSLLGKLYLRSRPLRKLLLSTLKVSCISRGRIAHGPRSSKALARWMHSPILATRNAASGVPLIPT